MRPIETALTCGHKGKPDVLQARLRTNAVILRARQAGVSPIFFEGNSFRMAHEGVKS
jgi:hypothetical protein